MKKKVFSLALCFSFFCSALQAITLSCEEDLSRAPIQSDWHPLRLQIGNLLAQADLPYSPQIEFIEDELGHAAIQAYAYSEEEDSGSVRFSLSAYRDKEDPTAEIFKALLQLCGSIEQCNESLYLAQDLVKELFLGPDSKASFAIRLIDSSFLLKGSFCLELTTEDAESGLRSLTRSYYCPGHVILHLSMEGSLQEAFDESFFNSLQLARLKEVS